MNLNVLLLLLLTAGAVFYGVMLVPRVRYVIRAGWRGMVTRRGALIGLLCGMAGLVLVVMVLATAWRALARGAGMIGMCISGPRYRCLSAALRSPGPIQVGSAAA